MSCRSGVGSASSGIMRWICWLGLGLAVAACRRHASPPMPGVPVRPEQPPPEGMQVPPPARPPVAPSPVPATTYRFLVTAESQDQVALLRFKPCQPGETPPPCGAGVERTYAVGQDPSAIEGPDGVVAGPDGRSFYVTLSRARPLGRLERYDVATGGRAGAVSLGTTPADVDISPRGDSVYVTDSVSLSRVAGEGMTGMPRVRTCATPQGSRVNPEGTRHYSACRRNDLLVEVDTRTMTVRRLFDVAPGREGSVPVVDAGAYPASDACSPTWAQPSTDGSLVFVACNKSGEIVVVDVAHWSLVKRWKTPPAPYHLAVSPDGRLLVATHQAPGSLSIWLLPDDSLAAEIPGTRPVAHGVAVGPDSRYAFFTLEGTGRDPGAVDIVDLKELRKVASVDLEGRATGIGILPGNR